MAAAKKKSAKKSGTKNSGAKKKLAGKSAPKSSASKAASKKTPAKFASKGAVTTKNSAPTKQSGPTKTSTAKASARAAAPTKAKRAEEKPKSFVTKIKAAVKATVENATGLIERVMHPDMFKSLTPLEDRLVVHVEKPAEKTAGGLFVPSTGTEKPNRGRVMAVGQGKRSKKGTLRPPDVKVGDFVLFAGYAGQTVTLQGTEFLILREEDVLGVSES